MQDFTPWKFAHQYWFRFRSECKHRLLQHAPTYQISCSSLTFRPNVCIPSPSYLIQTVMRRRLNIKKTCQHQCMYIVAIRFISYCSWFLIVLHGWKEEWFIFLLIPNLHRETFVHICSRPGNRYVRRLIIQHCI